jgi:hypothetical protein
LQNQRTIQAALLQDTTYVKYDSGRGLGNAGLAVGTDGLIGEIWHEEPDLAVDYTRFTRRVRGASLPFP